jgi:phage tail protein X
MTYYTRQNENLDYICWKHYYNSSILDSLLAQEADQYDPAKEVLDIFDIGTMSGRDDEEMGKIVNKVLDANPHLMEHGIFLPAGLKIDLPEIDEIVTAGEIVQLWD